MGTIRSQMTLNDGMSAVLKKITKALDTTVTAFEEMQKASGNAMDTKLLKSTHTMLAQCNTEIDQMAAEYEKAEKRQQKLNDAINKGTSSAGGLLKKITGIAGAYMSINAVKGLVTDSMGLADTQIGVQTQLKTVTNNMGTGDYYDQIIQKASDVQGRGMYGDEAMIAGAAELSTYFTDGEAILSMMDTLTNYAAGMSGGGAVDEKAMTDYATGLGKIMVGSFDAMAQKGFEFSDAQKAIIEGTATQKQICEELGDEYVNLSTDMQAAAVIGSVIDEGWSGLYDAMSQTPEGQIIQFKNTLGDLKEMIGAGLYPAILNFMALFQENLPQVQEFADLFVQAVGVIINILTQAVNLALQAASFIQSNWSIIGPVVGVVAAAFIAYKVATIAAAAAQWLLNAAMTASPITWIIMLIAVVIGLLYGVVAVINKVTGSSISATGRICGAIAVAGAIIANLAIGVLNAIIQYIWTIFVAPFLGIVEWILNVCNGGFNSFGDAVANLIGQIIGWFLNLGKVVTTIIDAIFGTNWTAGLESLQSSVTAWGKNENAITLDKNAPTIDYRFEYGDAWAAGNDFGKGIDDKISGMFNMGGLGDTSSFDLGDIAAYTGETADNTGKTADALAVTEEQLEYLRDIAERDAINRFTTAEVKIDMTGMTNRIDGSADLDGVISQLTDGFAEALVTAAEGVHA